MNKEPVVISWSGGKDSMLALHEVRASGEFEVAAALTTVSREYERICMHGVRPLAPAPAGGGVGSPVRGNRAPAQSDERGLRSRSGRGA